MTTLVQNTLPSDPGQAATGALPLDQREIPDAVVWSLYAELHSDGGRPLPPTPEITALIERHAVPVAGREPTLHDIPQDKRRAFLTDLAVLKGCDPTAILSTLEGMLFDRTDTSDNPLADFDRKLIENGYEPVAINGKAPVENLWQAGEVTVERIAEVRRRHPTAKSTGLRTGRLVGVDIDLREVEHAERIRHFTFEVLGETDMQRVGSKGAMLCYRNETPIRKIIIRGKHTPEQKNPGTLVEVLGQGQQFVAYGIHPDTERNYDWPNLAAGAAPLQRPISNLPETAPDKIREFAQRAAAMLSELGYFDVEVMDTGDPEKRAARTAKRRDKRAPVPVVP